VPLGVPLNNQWFVPPEVIQQVINEYENTPVSLFDKYNIANQMHQIFTLMKQKNKNVFGEIQTHFTKLAYDLRMSNIIPDNQIENYKHTLESYIYIILAAEKEDINIYIKEIISYIDKILVGFAAVYEIHFK